MTAQGSSRLSMSFAVSDSSLAACVERLHREFFRAPDAELFAATPESAHAVSSARAAITMEPSESVSGSFNAGQAQNLTGG